MADAQATLQSLSEQYQKLQQGKPQSPHNTSRVLKPLLDLQNHVQSRQRLESQQQENIGVQKVRHNPPLSLIAPFLRSQAYHKNQEFSSLEDDANIYKLVGPVLLKQEKSEAIMAVDGRLEFIGNEM